MTSLVNIPDDVLINEIFPNMSFTELTNLSNTSKKYKDLIKSYTIMKSGKILANLTDTEIFSLIKKYPILQLAAVKELYRRAPKSYTDKIEDIELMRIILIDALFRLVQDLKRSL